MCYTLTVNISMRDLDNLIFIRRENMWDAFRKLEMLVSRQ